ncbi:hypothetical protein ACIRQY_31235 [Streptomyces sp. NPDC101490]|uniref:hypothetical protein n=1 Tax=Streptomyces sp. NPDC101490 TaxID=3366143 RepID=UPI003821F34F
MRADLRLSLTAVVTAAALAATTAPALAEDTPVSSPVGVGRAVTDETQRGTFKVTAWTDARGAKITAVSARVRQGDTVLAEFPALSSLASWSDPSLEAAYAPPAGTVLKLVEDGGVMPALGTYAIDVTATDSLGNRITRTDAGRLDFRVRPELKFGVSVPSWEDRAARGQGTLIGVEPGSGDVVPLGGRTITLRPPESSGGTVHTAVTDGTGAFTGSPVPIPRGSYESFAATFTEDSAEVHGTTSEYRWVDSLKARQVKVTATADKKRAANGEPVTVSGRMTDPATGNAPLANQPVRVYLGHHEYGRPYGKTVHTDADGRFSVRLIAAAGIEGAGYWRVDSADPYLMFPLLSGVLAVPVESRTDRLSTSLTANGKLTVTGVFRARYQLHSFPDRQQYVQLEQAVNGVWKKVGPTASVNSLYWNTFTISLNSRGGWFRLRHLTSDEFAESSTPSFRLARAETRTVGLNAGPEPVRKGADVTVTGAVQHYLDGAWRTLGNATVKLEFQPRGSTSWKPVGTGRASRSGQVSLRAKATADGSWRIRYYGDATHFDSPANAGGDYVDVR